MKVIIPIKQVPETSNVKMDPVTGTMVREGVEPIINILTARILPRTCMLIEWQ